MEMAKDLGAIMAPPLEGVRAAHFHLAPLLTSIASLHFHEILSIQKDNSTLGNQSLYHCNLRAHSVHNSTILGEASGSEHIRGTIFKRKLNIYFKAKHVE